MSNVIKDEAFDYYQEVARSAFADMLHDTERNQKYSRGLKIAIDKMKSRGRKANVLDIGTGTGLLAMLAAQHGADTVTTIEAFSPVSHIARKIIETNGFKDKIRIINKHSTEVKVGPGGDMSERANILVAEVLDTELIGEGAIKTYNHAHQHLMEEDCLCVPDSASIYIQIVDSPTVVAWNTFKSTGLIKCPENVS
jgi:type III protein arginine methyltransferase